MRPSRVWLAVTALAFAAWIGYLIYLTQTADRPSIVLSRPQFKNSVLLVSGGRKGEGILISEVAARESRPGHIVLRASKMLASDDWMGRNYRPLFQDQREVLQYLEGIPVGIVIIKGDGRNTPHGRRTSARWHSFDRVAAVRTGLRRGNAVSA